MSDVHVYIFEMLKQYVNLGHDTDDGAYDFVKWITDMSDEEMYKMLKDNDEE